MNGFPLELPVVEKFFTGVEAAGDVQGGRVWRRRPQVLDDAGTKIRLISFVHDNDWKQVEQVGIIIFNVNRSIEIAVIRSLI